MLSVTRRAAVLLLAATLVGVHDAGAQDFVIRRWLLRGALPADTGRAGVARDYLGGETVLRPDSGDVVAGGAFIAADADSLGHIDLNRALPNGREWAVGYALAYVFAPRELTAQLVMDSDDDLVAFLNGQQVWFNYVPRGVGAGRDTMTVRLASGWNTLLLKVVNRGGGFDVLGRFAPSPGEGSLDGMRSTIRRPPELVQGFLRPASTIIASQLFVADQLTWNGSTLEARGTAHLSAWGAVPLERIVARFEQGTTRWGGDTLARLEPGATAEVRFGPTFDELRRAALGQPPLGVSFTWAGATRSSSLGVDPDRLLRRLWSRLALGSWIVDTTGGTQRLQTSVVVPTVMSGLTVDLHVAEYGTGSRFTVNRQARPWYDGRVELCAACRPGDTLAIAITLERGHVRRVFPEARIRDIGYPEYADGYDYARALTGRAPAITRPDARAWLATLGDTAAHRALVSRHAAAYAPLAAETRRDTLWLVGNSHIDAAWLWPWSETVDVIRNTWRSSLRIASAFPGYIFAASSPSFFEAMDRLEPTLADSLTRAVASGTFALVGGWWVEPDQNLPSGESLARQGLYGQRYLQRRFGRRARTAWTPDSFGYPWTLPQIYRLSGFEAFVTQKIRWNDSTQLPYNAFWWQGRDGTRLFTYNPYGYDHDLETRRLVAQRLEDRQRHPGLAHQMVLYGVGDHGGGPTIQMLQRAEDARRSPTLPVMRYASPDTALAAMRRSQPDAFFPVWQDELYLEYHRGTFTTQARQKWSLGRSETALRTAEALAVLDTAAYPRAELLDAWRRVLFNQFHDILPGSSIRQVYLDADAQYDSAWSITDRLIARGISSLAARMDTRGPRGRTPLVVFNPLAWVRSGYVTDTISGRAVWVPDVPALGARVVWLDPARPGLVLDARGRSLPTPRVSPAVHATSLENAYVRVDVDTTTGTITRIVDKTSGREVLATGGRANVLEVFGDRPSNWDAWDIGYTGERWEVTETADVRRGADSEHAWMSFTRRWGRSTFTQTLELTRAHPWLEVRTVADWQERRKLLKVGFRLATAPDSLMCAIPYGAIGRTGRPRTQAERAKYEFPCQRWVDAADSGGGAAVITDSKYGWDYRGDTLRLSLLRAPLWPDSLADRGRHEFRYVLWPHRGDWRTAGVVRRAAEYHVPLVARVEPAHAGSPGAVTGLVSVDAANVEIAAVKRAEDSDALVLRVVERHGQSADVTVTLPSAIRSARLANLLEDPGAPLQPSGSTLRLQLRPWEIATVLVELDR